MLEISLIDAARGSLGRLQKMLILAKTQLHPASPNSNSDPSISFPPPAYIATRHLPLHRRTADDATINATTALLVWGFCSHVNVGAENLCLTKHAPPAPPR
jgi:hypothetical protein